MADEMPPSGDFSGLTRTVLRYSEAFKEIVGKARAGTLADADWAEIETLVDVDAFERIGVFLGPVAEILGWPTYRGYVAGYAGDTEWEGTLRHVTEQPGRVILELAERNIRGDVTHVANTVTIYDFTAAGRIRHLDVYVMPLG